MGISPSKFGRVRTMFCMRFLKVSNCGTHINCYCMLIKSLAMNVVSNLRIILVKHKVKLILTERVLSFGRKLYPKELEIPWNVTIG